MSAVDGLALPEEIDPALRAGAAAAYRAFHLARVAHTPLELAEPLGMGADGTPTMRIDALVEAPVVEALSRLGVNILSEEVGFLDAGSARSLVIDPLDGSANAAAGVPLSAYSATVAEDGKFTEALTVWLDAGRWWWARPGERGIVFDGAVRRPLRTTGREQLTGAAISLLRPHTAVPGPAAAWWAAAQAAARVRILSTSCLEIGLVASGAIDAFADAGSQTHRLVDIAAGVVLAESAGGAMVDAFGSPIEFDTDLSRRWSGVCGATPALARELAATIACHANRK